MSNPLDPVALLLLLPTLLPRSTSSPLPRPTDAVAALVHTIHTALEFRLTQPSTASTSTTTVSSGSAAATTSEQQAQHDEPDIDDNASDTATAVDQEDEETSSPLPGQLPVEWNSRGEESYIFEYRHAQSSLVFRVRVGRMGGRVQVDATAEDGAPNSLSIVLADLLTPPAFPIPSSATSSTAASSSSSSSSEAPAKSIGFKSVESVKNFVEQYKRDIIAKILPGLQKEGYTESPSGSGSDPRNPPPSQPRGNDPQPARPDPLIDPSHPGHPGVYPGRPHPASVGHRDLEPQGLNPRPGFVNDPTLDPSGGMYMDFNHPLFDGRRGGGRGGHPDLDGPGGMINPPGARWDPVGPGMGGNPRFPSAGGNPLGGVGVGGPDWGDELPPPGEYGPELGRLGGGGIGGVGRGRGRGGPGGPGGLGGPGFGGGLGGGGFGGLGGGGRGRFGGGGGGGGGFGGGGGMYM